MSKIELALKKHHTKPDLVPIPLTLEQLCPQAWPSLQKAYIDLKEVEVQQKFLKIVESQGGTEWTFRIIYNPVIYNEVHKFGPKLILSLDEIHGFEHCTLYMENTKEISEPVSNTPTNYRTPDTLIKVRYQKPWNWWFW